jgi:hypothetical protein
MIRSVYRNSRTNFSASEFSPLTLISIYSPGFIIKGGAFIDLASSILKIELVDELIVFKLDEPPTPLFSLLR